MDATLDHVGPMTKTVADCALLLEVMIRFTQFQYPQLMDVSLFVLY